MGTTLGGGGAAHVGDEHLWFRAHLADHLLDLLDDTERERLMRHGAGCSECGGLLAAALARSGDWWAGAGHVPVEQLVRLRRADASPALEPARRHLEACASCREDLAALAGEGEASAPLPLRQPVRVIAPSPPAWRNWGWSLAGAAGALVTAGAVIWMRSAGPSPSPSPLAPGASMPAAPPGQPPAPAAADVHAEAPPPAPDLVAGPFAIQPGTRSAGENMTEIALGAQAKTVALTLPALYLADDTVLVIELCSTDGAVVSRGKVTAARASLPGGVRLSVAGLATGAYVLHVSWTEAGAGESMRDYPLHVSLQP